jgi:hypothetical protein
MSSHPGQTTTPPPAADQHQAAGRDRRAVRTVDLTEEDIAAIEASEMTPGFEHLDAELEPEPASLVEEGVRSARELRARGDRTDARPADKAFRDSLYDDG